jgi:hypothetical protein
MIKFFSRLPMRALYAFSTFLYLLAFYVVRHRHQVIREQIRKVFPDSSDAEQVRIHKRFLRNFCDVLVEVVKSVSMHADDMRDRMRIVNLEAARRHLDAGQSLMFVTSHLCNWEWLLHGMALQLGYPVDAAYKPLHDQWAERLMLKIRSRFGARLVPAKELLADFLKRRGIVRALDPVPGTGHRLLRRRRSDCARDPPAGLVCEHAQNSPRILRGRSKASVGRTRGDRAQHRDRALRPRLRNRRAQEPRGLALVVPPLAAEKTSVRQRLMGYAAVAALSLPSRCFASFATVG